MGSAIPPTTHSPVFWRADANPAVLPVTAEGMSARSADAFDLRRLAVAVAVLHVAHGATANQVVIGEASHRIQLEVRQGSLLEGPVRLHYELAGLAHLGPKLLTLRRLLALQMHGQIPRSLSPPDPRAPRWVAALRALDAHRAGAPQRDIAAALWGEAAVTAEWRGRSDYLRARVKRAIGLGETLAQGEYRRLLRG